MRHDSSRKSFFHKLFGLVAIAGLAPKLFVRPAARTAAPRVDGKTALLRPETRAVPRGVDSA